MKKVVLVILTALNASVIFAQAANDASEKRSQYGFNIGLNYSNAYSKNDLPAQSSIHNGVGFSLGLLADYKITDALSFSPKTELAFFNSKASRSLTDGSESTYEIMPIALDIKAHLTVKKVGERISPYLLIGPSVKIPIGDQSNVTTEFGTGYDVAIDFGIGLFKGYTWFNLSPELRYSYGLMNVNQNPVYKSMYFNNISLILNILG